MNMDKRTSVNVFLDKVKFSYNAFQTDWSTHRA